MLPKLISQVRSDLLQDQRRVPGGETLRLADVGHVGCGWIRACRTGADQQRRLAFLRPEEDEEGADRGDASAAAHHVGEGDHGGGES